MIGAISTEDAKAGFRSGGHPLDDYFKRHALTNDRAGISRCFVLRPEQADLPQVSGFYTLSMAAVQADALRPVLKERLPRYPFYLKYGLETIEGEGWPRRMFLPIATVTAAADALAQRS